MPEQVSHHNPLHSFAAILGGRSDKTLQQWANTDHKSRQNPDSQPFTAVAADKSATSENLQRNATSSTRENRLLLNPDRERNDKSEVWRRAVVAAVMAVLGAFFTCFFFHFFFFPLAFLFILFCFDFLKVLYIRAGQK